jgi:hypothetical protein
VNKKKQKTFPSIGFGAAAPPRPMDKVFCALFSKKRRFLAFAGVSYAVEARP